MFLKPENSDFITIERLSFKIALSPLPMEIIKPVTKKELREILSNNIYFLYDKENDAVRLFTNNELSEKIKNYFNQNYSPISISDTKYDKAGILAIKFTGKEFPLSEAKEYINVRPIIFLCDVAKNSSIKDILLINRELSEKESNDIKYLKCLFDNDQEFINWLENNTSVSFHETHPKIIKYVHPKLLEDLSPIFNIQHNPGNLFQYTLKTKFEEYLKKQRK